MTSAATAGTFVADGPRAFTRATASPVVERFTFGVLDPAARYELRIGTGTVTSAVVTLNGAEIFGTNDFKEHVPSLVKAVTLRAQNELTVELRGKPDETMTLNVIGFDDVAPTISVAITPAANVAGWHSSDVTLTYTCDDRTSGIQTCPAPVVVATEGLAQAIAGSAIDRAGNVGNAIITISLDKTAPVAHIITPEEGVVLGGAETAVQGSVSDVLSSVASVTCNGNVAILSGSAFDCSAALAEGENAITVIATDVAGNTSTTQRIVNVSSTPRVTLLEPVNLTFTNISPVTVRGTVSDPTATVQVNGVPATLSGTTFIATVPLVEGNNTLSAVARNAGGRIGTGAIQITLDTTAPRVAITTPNAGFETSDAAIAVGGMVNDIVVGTVNDEQAQVTVNGVAATVANRTFIAPAVALQPGANTIRVVARDRVGNSFTTSVDVNRLAANQPLIRVAAGSNQNGTIGTAIAQPLTVTVTNALGQPAAGEAVVFKVLEGNGLLSNGGAPRPWVAVTTDMQGRASASYTLGTRAGAGNNKVQATATGFAGTAVFVASATPTDAAAISVDAGQGQTGATGEALAFPFVVVVTDAGHNRLSGVPVTFNVTEGGGSIGGETTVTSTTDSDGRAVAVLTLGEEAGFDNNIVEATYAGNAGTRAVFNATAKTPGREADTKITGVVLDNSNQPLAGVTVRLYRAYLASNSNVPLAMVTPVTTDEHGQFVIENAPVGAFKLVADGSTFPGPNAYPPVEFDIVTVAGQENTVGMPIYLPVLDRVNRLCVSETIGGTLTLASVPGFSFHVPAGSATFPGGSRSGCITVTPVHGDKVPMVPGFGQQPRFVVTIQPVGTHFSPPASITFPNVDGLAPREVTEMYSYDHDLSTFVAIGTATVSDDGSVLRSDPGVGVLKAGWHCGGNPNTTGAAATCPQCKKCEGQSCIPVPGPCDDKKVCTTDDKCSNGKCEGTAVKPETLPTFTQAINFEKALDPVKNFLRNRFNINKDFGLQGTMVTGVMKECCESKKGAKVENTYLQVGVQAGYSDEFPTPYSITIPFVGKSGIFVTVGLSVGISGSLKEDNCDGGSTGTLTGQISGTLGGKVYLIKTSDDIVNVSVAAQGGLTAGVQGTIKKGVIEGEVAGGHTGLVASATVHLMNGAVEYSGTVTLVEPGALGNVPFVVAFSN